MPKFNNSPGTPADYRLLSAGLCRLVWGAMALLLITSSTGCVQRKLIIQSQPEGAFVSIDRQPIGYTPVAVDFTYYGTRDIQLEKDGYKVTRVQQRIRPPWYDKFPISLFSNHFSPRELRDERLLDFALEPRVQPNENLLIDRANQLRGNIQRGTLTTPVR